MSWNVVFTVMVWFVLSLFTTSSIYVHAGAAPIISSASAKIVHSGFNTVDVSFTLDVPGQVYFLVVESSVGEIDDSRLSVTDAETVYLARESMDNVYDCGFWDLAAGATQQVR